jgi:hypothetical protein
MMKLPGHKNKFQTSWLEGIWLGRSRLSNEHIVATEQGVELTRTVRRRVAQRRWDRGVYLRACGVPWKPKLGVAQRKRTEADEPAPVHQVRTPPQEGQEGASSSSSSSDDEDGDGDDMAMLMRTGMMLTMPF